MSDKETGLLEEVADKKFTRRDLFKAAGTGAAGLAVLAAGKPRQALAEVRRQLAGARYALAIDLRRCIGCKACSVACKSEFDVRLGVFRASVKEHEKGKGGKRRRHFLPWLCNHCGKPPCVPVCPVEPRKAVHRWPDGSTTDYEKRATFKRPDGPVLIDYERCIGCGNCVQACPYKVRFFDPVKIAGANRRAKAVDKCTFCVHRIDEGVVPSCVNTCLGRARIFGDINDPRSEISRLLDENDFDVLLPERGTIPQVFYISLDKDVYDKGVDTR